MNRPDETAETRHLAETEERIARWQRLKRLFESAAGMGAAEREKFLNDECQNDGKLRRDIDRLLSGIEGSDGFLESPAAIEVASMFEGRNPERTTNTTGEGDFVAGTILASRYRILGLLGRGGMGEVYKAEDIKLSQTVALKFLPEKLENDPDALGRFHAEVRNARQVSHPNVCRVFDIGEVDKRHFLSMEFIDGDDLSSLLRRVGRLPSERGIEIARQLCIGLSAIHKAGILHRDFKPANVIIDSKGLARITDFGIAGLEQELAREKVRAGTPAYMAPEQIAGRDISQRSDIYSLGLVLYEIFTGKQAFTADSMPELIRKQQSETPTNPSDFVKGIDPLVESVIFQCLEKGPLDRPPTALHVAMALPGGNPMQIALDAGQTPSPEMIAATPRKGVLTVNFAAVCLATVIVATLIGVYANRFYESYSYVPLEKSAEVLAERAQTIIKRFGYTDRPVDVKYRFDFNSDFIRYAKEQDSIGDIAPYLRNGQPWIMLLTYRQSPRPMVPSSSGRVFYNDPPQVIPGMINTYVDTTGRLVEFSAVPPNVSEPEIDAPSVDWNQFFAEAGLDPTKFQVAASQWTPPYPFDERLAWTGTMPNFSEIPLRIEAASFQGKAIYFRVVAPWNRPRQAFSSESTEIDWGYVILLVIFVAMFIGGAFLIWHNIRSGRADVRGTYRLVLFMFAVFLVVSLLQYDHNFGSSVEFFILGGLLRDILFPSVLAGLAYLALEPFVRRWWPESLVSWSRLLAGDARDPMVGRDVLVGAALGTLSVLVRYLRPFVSEIGFDEPRSIESDFMADATNGFLRAMGVYLESIAGSTFNGLGMFFLILMIYFLTRRKGLSILLFCAVLMITADDALKGSLVNYIAGFLSLTIFGWVIYKFGLLAMISFLFFAYVSMRQPLTLDPVNILFPQTIAALMITFAIAASAGWISIGGARGFESKSQV